MTIPRSEVALSLSIDTIKRLPKRSMYYSRSGQASVTVQYENDTISITATCDSLQRQIEYYEVKIEEYKAINEDYKNCIEEMENEFPSYIKIMVMAFLLGIFAGIILQKSQIGNS